MRKTRRKSYSLKKSMGAKLMNRKSKQQQDAWEKFYMSESKRGYNRSMGKIMKNPFHELSSFDGDFFGRTMTQLMSGLGRGMKKWF